MLRETTPDAGPWFEIISLLRKCDEAFNDSVAAVGHRGMPANRIACISHMLCDEEGLGLTAGFGTIGGGAAVTTDKKGVFLMHLSRRLICLRSVSVKIRIGLLLKQKRQWLDCFLSRQLVVLMISAVQEAMVVAVVRRRHMRL